MMNRLVSWMMLQSLRGAFRRVCWVGDLPDLPADRPVVVYANHHSFYDGYLLWLLATRTLLRTPTTWMAEWDRFPVFSAVGAQPFPPDAPQRRTATMRRTARLFARQARTLLIYFPEGRLHPPEDGILPFPAEALLRMNRLFPTAFWLPVAIHVTWEGASRPTALLQGGPAHPAADGHEADRLHGCWQALRTSPPRCTRLLLDGRPSPDERWSFAFTRRWFNRYL
jgi:1-acyl-sn-glycerol-3-phosphate acyltransferase